MAACCVRQDSYSGSYKTWRIFFTGCFSAQELHHESIMDVISLVKSKPQDSVGCAEHAQVLTAEMVAFFFYHSAALFGKIPQSSQNAKTWNSEVLKAQPLYVHCSQPHYDDVMFAGKPCLFLQCEEVVVKRLVFTPFLHLRTIHFCACLYIVWEFNAYVKFVFVYLCVKLLFICSLWLPFDALYLCSLFVFPREWSLFDFYLFIHTHHWL